MERVGNERNSQAVPHGVGVGGSSGSGSGESGDDTFGLVHEGLVFITSEGHFDDTPPVEGEFFVFTYGTTLDLDINDPPVLRSLKRTAMRIGGVLDLLWALQTDMKTLSPSPEIYKYTDCSYVSAAGDHLFVPSTSNRYRIKPN